MKRKKLIERIIKTIFGLFIFSLGDYLIILAGLGASPWDAISLGVTNYLPISYGVIHTVTSIVILAIDILMKEKIGIGTILDAVLVGPFVDLFAFLFKLAGVSSINSIVLSVVIFIAGLFGMALGQVFYMSGALSCGPRDSLLVGLGKRMPKIKIGFVDMGLKLSLVAIALIIKGPVGPGTLIAMIGMGTAMQIVFSLFKFEPRDVVHEGLLESLKTIIGK